MGHRSVIKGRPVGRTLLCLGVLIALSVLCLDPFGDVLAIIRLIGLGVVCGFLLRAYGMAGFLHLGVASCIVLTLTTILCLFGDVVHSALLKTTGRVVVLYIAPSFVGMCGGVIFQRMFSSMRAEKIGCFAAIVVALLLWHISLVLNVCQSTFFRWSGSPARHCNAKDLARTVVVPTLDAPLNGNTSVIWCATAQLAWNEMMAMAGGAVNGTGNTNVVDALNRRDVTKDHVDPATCVGVAGRGANAAQEVRRRLEAEGWANANEMGYEAPQNPIDTDGIVAFCSMRCNLEFRWVFERMKEPLKFNGVDVKSFGIDDYSTKNSEQMLRAGQVIIWETTNVARRSTDFVIELKTRYTNHHLIIAHVSPSSSLGETIDSVSRRIAASAPDSMDNNCRLAIPVVDFDVMRQYTELNGCSLSSRKSGNQLGPLVQFDQRIQVRLDERGFSLSSWALLVAMGRTTPLVVDGPFLLMVRYKDSPKPYFAAWIANEELLEKF